MRTTIAIAALLFASLAPGSASSQSISETADSLESAISDLQSALDDLEEYRGSADEDLSGALRAVRNAHQTMRSTAISLLLNSLSASRPKEAERTMNALRVLEPRLFDKPKVAPARP